MKWVIRNAITEDVFERFSRTDGRPVWSNSLKKAKWFTDWTEVQVAISIIQKCGDESYPVSEAFERNL